MRFSPSRGGLDGSLEALLVTTISIDGSGRLWNNVVKMIEVFPI